jgi:site-specific DNA-methyltransferase (adenine-specific)
MNLTEKIKITNEDNMQLMARYPDNYFELAIVDPPYGLNDRLIKGGASGGMGSMRNLADNKVELWDEIPNKEYFLELFRISKNQIIWGGNYFLDFLGATDGFVVWNKMNGTNPMADCELAWQNVKGTTRMLSWHHFSGQRTTKIHPTQKPVKLYEWLLMNYAKEGDKILDTHLGSGSIAIACHNLGFELTACELDEDYYNASIKRIQNHISQQRLF